MDGPAVDEVVAEDGKCRERLMVARGAILTYPSTDFTVSEKTSR